jgi:hypothetical protein
MLRRVMPLAALLPALLALGGCPTPPTPAPTGLTPERVTLLGEVLQRYRTTLSALLLLRDGVDAVQRWEAGDAPAAAACPTEAFDDWGIVRRVVLDYGDGCVADHGAALRGRLVMEWAPGTAVARFALTDFTIDGRAVEASGTVAFARVEDQTTLVAGSFTSEPAGLGEISGIVTLEYHVRRDGPVQVANGVWLLRALGLDIELAGPTTAGGLPVVINPTGNPDLVPLAGQIGLQAPRGDRFEIVFDESSAARRAAAVTISGDGPYELPLPSAD